MPGEEDFTASPRWRMTNAPRQISPDFPPTLIPDLIAILVGCCLRRCPPLLRLPTGRSAPTASNTVTTPHLATGEHIKAASTRRKTSEEEREKKRGPVAMATCGSISEWPRASISLLGWELITCINHRRRLPPPTPAGLSADGRSRFCFSPHQQPVEETRSAASLYIIQHIYVELWLISP